MKKLLTMLGAALLAVAAQATITVYWDENVEGAWFSCVGVCYPGMEIEAEEIGFSFEVDALQGYTYEGVDLPDWVCDGSKSSCLYGWLSEEDLRANDGWIEIPAPKKLQYQLTWTAGENIESVTAQILFDDGRILNNGDFFEAFDSFSVEVKAKSGYTFETVVNSSPANWEFVGSPDTIKKKFTNEARNIAVEIPTPVKNLTPGSEECPWEAGENVKAWTNGVKTLVLNGSGSVTLTPWSEVAGSIVEVQKDKGVDGLGDIVETLPNLEYVNGLSLAELKGFAGTEPSVEITEASSGIPGSGVVNYTYTVSDLGGKAYDLHVKVSAKGCAETENVVIENVSAGSVKTSVDVKTLLGKAYPNVTLFAKLVERAAK